MSALKTGVYTMEDLKNHYYRRNHGHWFDAGTMRFFKSRLGERLIPVILISFFGADF